MGHHLHTTFFLDQRPLVPLYRKHKVTNVRFLNVHEAQPTHLPTGFFQSNYITEDQR
jgi:hypothetical protein